MSRKSRFASIVVPVLVGSVGLIHLMSQPRFDTFHKVDVLQLLASGMCLGIALSAVFALVRSNRGA